MTINKKAANKATTPDKPITPVSEIIKAKAKTITKSQENWLNCPKCNKAYKKPDNLAKHIATCTGKHDGGRKPGVVSEQKMILNTQKKLMQERIAKNVDKLLNAQMNLALGQTMLFVKVTERDSKGKPIRVYHERVESQETIKEYLDDPEALNTDENYYYITTRPASNQAIANLLDRAFGKPKENVELSEDPDAPVGVAGTGTTSAVRQMVLDTIREQLKKPRGGK